MQPFRVVEAIKADKEIMGLIERIKRHEWVRVIEGVVEDVFRARRN